MLDGRVETGALVASDRDEISRLVGRIKRAADGRKVASAPAVSPQDLQWAEDMQLPRAFFEFFEIQRG